MGQCDTADALQRTHFEIVEHMNIPTYSSHRRFFDVSEFRFTLEELALASVMPGE